MLPLWIIDITEKSSRRDCFVSLVEKIKHVYIPSNTDFWGRKVASSEIVNENVGSIEPKNFSKNNSQDAIVVFNDNMINEGDISLQEELDERDRRLATKRTAISGNYWFYSQVACKELPPSGSNVELGEVLYDFQSSLVKEGIKFISNLRKSNVQPYQTINIVVLGDVTENQTQLLFPSIALMLQKEKGRFLPHHIHQGMEIMGMLYLPCDINTKDVNERVKIQRTLKEIEVQHINSSVRGYDHMMLYQDVQNRTEANYSMLDEKGQAEYLLQCLIHLFYACDTIHPLLSGTSSADNFYFSMGATSAFFDMAIEDEIDCSNIMSNIVNKFKEKGDKEKTEDKDLCILSTDIIEAEQFIKKATEIENLDIDSINLKEPNPHPIKDYLKDSLKRLYYKVYLRKFPINLMTKIFEHIDENTKEVLQDISIERKRAYRHTAMAIKPAITHIIEKVTTDDGGLYYIEDKLKETQGKLSKQKSKIKNCMEVEFWSHVQENHVSRTLKKHFEEYHDSYLHDNEINNGGAGCADLKKEALKNLTGHISEESTTLSVIARSVLAGIIFALAAVPILNVLSPNIIDLGRIKRYSEFWYTFMFFIPAIIQIIKYYLYNRKKNMFIRVLKSYYLHDAYARVANRIEMESVLFYDRLTELCGEYLNRCKKIRQNVHVENFKSELNIELPITMFNINLNGGKFAGETIIPDDMIERARIRIAGKPRFVNELDRPLYYLLINKFKNEFSMLFNDVDIYDNKNMILDKDTGKYKFRSHAEIEEEENANWQKSVVDFKKTLYESIKKEILPREHPTVCDNLIQYYKTTKQTEFLEPMLNYAATNGEITSSADYEYADIKANRDVEELFKGYLPYYNTKCQVDLFASLYSKYIFVTRWRSFEHFSLNRILPREDFDIDIRRLRVTEDKEQKNDIPMSSVLLWALFPKDGVSSDWIKLFDDANYNEAYERSCALRDKLNTND